MDDRLATQQERKKAREMYAEEGYVEIDENAAASRADDAVWVQAWVRVPHYALAGCDVIDDTREKGACRDD